MYYNPNDLLSFNRFINFIVGTRGVGKTYFCKKYCIDQYIKKSRRFVWVRRSDTEIKKLYTKFFTDIKNIYDDYEFKTTTSNIYIRKIVYNDNGDYDKEIQNEWEICGYFIPLSTSLQIKSDSFEDCDTLVYDEIFTKLSYLKDEVFIFLELIESIFRMRNGRIFLLSNKLSVDNPYFNEWNITELSRRFTKVGRSIVIENCDASKDFKTAKKLSPVGQLISLSKNYEKYNLDNEFALDDSTNICIMPKGDCSFRNNLILNGVKIGYYQINGFCYFGDFVENARNYTIYVDDTLKNDCILIDKKHNLLNFIARNYKNKNCLYSNMRIKNEIILLCRYVIKNY